MQIVSERIEQCGSRYYTDAQGRDFISVTSILKRYADMTTIINWRNRIGSEEADRISRQSAERGKDIHTLIEHYLQDPLEGLSKVAHSDDLAKQTLVGINSFYKHVNFHSVEALVHYDKEGKRYAGRYDQIIDVPANIFDVYSHRIAEPIGKLKKGLYIGDLKTKRSFPRFDTTEYLLKHLLQMSAYYKVLTEDSGMDIQGAILVFLTKTKCRPVVISKDKLENIYWPIFYAMLSNVYDESYPVKAWNDYVADTSSIYDIELGEFISHAPNCICLTS